MAVDKTTGSRRRRPRGRSIYRGASATDFSATGVVARDPDALKKTAGSTPATRPDPVVGFDPGLGVSVTRSGKSLDVRGQQSPQVDWRRALDVGVGSVLFGVPVSETNLGRVARGERPQLALDAPAGSTFEEAAAFSQQNLGLMPFPVGRAAGRAAAKKGESVYRPRTLTVNDLEAQLPKARSVLGRLQESKNPAARAVGTFTPNLTNAERAVDAVSRRLDRSERARNFPGVRLATASERATKAVGRSQRLERNRAVGARIIELKAIRSVKAGSRDDTANFWYAQLPQTARNATGLRAVQAKQREHLEYLTSGKALDDANQRERAVAAKLYANSIRGAVEDVPSGTIEPGVIVHAADRDNYGQVVGISGDTAAVHFVNRADGTEATVDLPLSSLTSSGKRVRTAAEGADVPEQTDDVFDLLREREQIRLYKTDIPQQIDDTSASIGQLDDLIANPPPVNDAAIAATRALGDEAADILVAAGRLNPDRVEPRRGLVAQWAGLEPTGEEAYIPHLLPTPDTRFPYTPQGGTGRVATPKGRVSENKLVLARTGRLRPTLRAATENWNSAQVFRSANQARDDLGNLGAPFAGNVPKNHVLVNPKGRTIPPNWKTEDFAQFTDGYEDVDTIRRRAQEIIDEFAADGSDANAVNRLKQAALEQGVQWDELRVVPKRLVDRYYQQFRPSTARGKYAKGYDALVDAAATSIVFARVGYIPKNIVQNLIMAVPHQGPLLLRNAVYAGQLMADPKIRGLVKAEIGNTGATGVIGTEAMSQKLGRVADVVGGVADDPVRATAFVHEAVAEGVLPSIPRPLTGRDRERFLRFLTSPSERAKLNDVRSRAVEAMADFSRLTPDQSRVARRLLIIPGWLMAGSRYPFHFAANHPVRSALLAYIAMGEPGAPEELRFNQPVTSYFTGTDYRQGIETPAGRLRTGSLNPVTTPWEIGGGLVGSARGKTGPFDYTTPTAFDYANPFAAAIIDAAQGEGLDRFQRLAPNYSLVRDLINPAAKPTYPEDATRLGRLKREIGVVPIEVNDPQKRSSSRSRRGGRGTSLYGGGQSGRGRSIYRP